MPETGVDEGPFVPAAVLNAEGDAAAADDPDADAVDGDNTGVAVMAAPDSTGSSAPAHNASLWTRFKRGQEKLAVAGTDFFGNMWTFYGFLALALCPLASPLKAYLPEVAYTSGVVIQLIALPLLAVGSRVIGRRSDALAQQMHDNVMTQLKSLQDEQQLHTGERQAALVRSRQLRDILPTLPQELQEYAQELMQAAGVAATAPVLPDLPDPVVADDPGPRTAIGRFNNRVAVIGTKAFGSMGAFWFLFALSLLPVIPGLHFLQHPMTYAIQSVLQLAALPLLAVGNVVLGKHSEQLARETAQATMENVSAVRQMEAEARVASANLNRENQVITDILREVPKLLERRAVAAKSLSLMTESREMLDNDVPRGKVLSHYRRVFTNCVLGESLKDARSKANLRVDQVASQAKVPVSQVIAAEAGHFATTRLGKRMATAIGADYDTLRREAADKGRSEARLARIVLG